MLNGYRPGGRHTETAVLANVLAYHGVTAPHTGQPFSEELLFGIGGGVGVGYYAIEMCGVSALALGMRHLWENGRAFLEGACTRIGATANVSETAGRKAAERNLREALDRGLPAIVWTDKASLPYHGLPPELVKYMIHIVGVYGISDDGARVLIDDRAPFPMTVTRDQLEDARAAITSSKNRLMTILPPPAPGDLEGAVRAGIRACHERLLAPPIKNFGLAALPKWAGLMVSTGDKKGWPRAFPPGASLYHALVSVFESVETSAGGGGAFRPMYADFLEQAAPIVRTPELTEAAEAFRESGRCWTALAHAALPDSVELFRAAKAGALERAGVRRESDAGACPAIPPSRDEQRAVERRYGVDMVSMLRRAEGQSLPPPSHSFPLTDAEARDLYAHIRAHLLRVHAAETRAVECLQGAAMASS